MTENEYGRKYQSRQLYAVDGSNARVLEPVRREEKQRYIREVEGEGRRQEKRHPLDGIDHFVFCVLMVATVIASIACFSYLKLQAKVTSMEKEISTMETSIMQQERDNKEAKEALEASVDLSYVYDVATEELGMVQPKKNQIKTYKNKKSNMVHQYTDVPGENEQ